MKKTAGIYSITNTVNGKMYIGQSINIEDRFRRHKYCLRNSRHYNLYLMKSVDKYGLENFKFEILFPINVTDLSPQDVKDILNDKEKEFIVIYNTMEAGYNSTSGGKSHVVSEETKRKSSESHKGIPASEKAKLLTSQRFLGIKRSKEFCEKISLAKKGQVPKCAGWNKGLSGYKVGPASEERKIKIGEAQKGQKNHNFGKTTPESVKQKCRDSYHGVQCHLAKLTDEKVLEIMQLFKNGFSATEISKEFSIALSTASRINRGEIWKHLTLNHQKI